METTLIFRQEGTDLNLSAPHLDVVPREGELVILSISGQRTRCRVKKVTYNLGGDTPLIYVEVDAGLQVPS